MITGIHKDMFFTINNSTDSPRTTRIWQGPENWYRNDWGLIIPNYGWMDEHIGEYDYSKTVDKLGICFEKDECKSEMGIMVYGENICLIQGVLVDARKYYPHLYTKSRLQLPILTRLTTLKNRMEFVHTDRSLTNSAPSPIKEDMPFEKYLEYIVENSTISNSSGQRGIVWYVKVDDLRKCEEHRAAGEFDKINQYWTCTDFGQVTIEPVSMDELLPYAWKHVSMV